MSRRFVHVTAYKDAGIDLPARSTRGSAGYDLAAAGEVVLPAGSFAKVPTGVKAYMEEDEVLLLYLRSSVALRYGITLANAVGVIDADYVDNPENEGHIQIICFNPGSKPVVVPRGERIAQGIFTRYLITDDDTVTCRRVGGFGSTGR